MRIRQQHIIWGIVAISALSSVPQILKSNDSRQRLTDQYSQAQEMKNSLDASIEATRAQAEVAEARYKGGCTFVSTLNSKGQTAAIGRRQPLVTTSGAAMPAGIVICDPSGVTAETVLGSDGKTYPDRFAFTGNQTVISEAKRKANIN